MSETKKPERVLREEEVLEFWKDNTIFEKTLEKEAPEGEFVFYEGPPTANGRPGIHHLESRSFKDIIPRYKTMRGYHVRRKGGWDTHGLPVELQVEKELGLKSKKEIEEYGIAEFNEKCKESVWQFAREWEQFTERIAYWVDLPEAYVTYYPQYIESLWWIVGQVNEKGLLYKDYKVLPWCPRCGTALSSHELAQGYKDVKDLSVTAKFELVDKPGTYVLAWTTTPWTLPGNVGLAVGEDIEYTKIQIGEEYFILAKDRLSVVSEEYTEVETVKGKDLVGKAYKPLYPYLADIISETEKDKLPNAYKIYSADFVTTEDGTGVVHTAVMYGQDDFVLGTDVGLPKVHLVDEEGHFVTGTDFLEGKFVKDEETAVEIIKDLAHRKPYSLLFSKQKYEHSYPHCWRCKTPVIYYARDSWYIRMSDLRDDLVSENEEINWEPEHIKEGRFGEWLRGIKDWAISRERYWGTPLPIWENEDGDRIVVSSYDDLFTHSKEKDLTKVFLMRHGFSEKNAINVFDNTDDTYPLTEEGRKQATEAAQKLKDAGIEAIYASPVRRARETAEIVAKELGLEVQLTEGLREIDSGEWQGLTHPERDAREDGKAYATAGYDDYYAMKRGKTGESWDDFAKRTAETLEDLTQKNQGSSILCVGHQGLIAYGAKHFKGLTPQETKVVFDSNDARKKAYPITWYISSKSGKEFDPHRPFIDDVVLLKDGKEYTRVKEVMDVWFDSGAMPFAQDHYPFDPSSRDDTSPSHYGAGIGELKYYPADYISEAIDQTRGWFYTLHAIGALLGKGKAYKNVICLGHILDSEGAKMSKSKGNTVNPWEMIDKYGVDPLRFWMYSVNQPGESKNFDEKTVDEIVKKVFNLLGNIVSFYTMFKDDSLEEVDPYTSPNVLDQWLLASFDSLVKESTDNLENYKVLEPARAIREFIGEFSQWYIRRSRDRFKSENLEDKAFAQATTHHVLLELLKLMAPFTPLTAEYLYSDLRGKKESIHFESWPVSRNSDTTVLSEMDIVRDVISLALDARDKAKIKVRQPLAKVTVKGKTFENDQYILQIKDEVNIKEVVFDESLSEDIILDTTITDELKEEGMVRELVRGIQGLRKKTELTPDEMVDLKVQTSEDGKTFVEKYKTDITSPTGLNNIIFEEGIEGEEISLDEFSFVICIEK